MKHLKKHPKQQRMEDMNIPGSRKFPTKKVKGLYRVTYGDVDMGSELTLDKLEAIEKDMRKVFKEDMTDKVIWEGREWLRSINDDNGFTLMPRIVWRVVAVVILVIICLVIVL